MRAHPAVSCTAAIIVLSLGLASCRRSRTPEAAPTAAASAAAPEAMASAAKEAAENTSVPTPGPATVDMDTAVEKVEETRGSNGGIKTPAELKHYPDTRRFLSLQMADAQEAKIEVPHDDAALIEMIRAGQLVRLAPITETYLLYEVGEDAKDDPLIHYDASTNKDVPLVGSMDALARKGAELEQQGAAGKARKAAMDAYYADPARAQQLFREYQSVASF